MKQRILWGALIVSGALLFFSCEEYFYPLTPDAEKAAGTTTTTPGTPDTPSGTGGDGGGFGLELVWE